MGDLVEADGFGVAHVGVAGLQEGQLYRRHNQLGVWHCPTHVRRVPAPLLGESMFSSEGITLTKV